MLESVRKQPKSTILISRNGSIELICSTIRKVGTQGSRSQIVASINKKFPYTSYTNKYAWLYDVFYFIQDNVNYQYDDPGKEQIKTPDRFVIKDGEGDCDDFTTLWIAILHSNGVRHTAKLVKYESNGHWAHVYIQVPSKQGHTVTLDNVIREFDKEVIYQVAKEF